MTTAAVPVVHWLLVPTSVGGNGMPGVGVVICEHWSGVKPPLATQSLALLSVPASPTPAFEPTPSPYANQAPMTPETGSSTNPVEVDGSSSTPLLVPPPVPPVPV